MTHARVAQPLPVSIVIPAFGAATQLRACLESLARHGPPGCDVLVADDATPDESVADVVKSFDARLRLTYVRRPQNLGFVANCNDAVRALIPTGNDVLLLNSDTEVTEGCLEEMWQVLHLHEKHAAVSPRSNNATIFSVPVSGALPAEESYRIWERIRSLLPRYQVMPTAVGFCMLIKNIVLRQFGLFDLVYSPGYNEENDFICRINRHGYSAVAAHHAFVFHHESSSFGSRRQALELRNRELLGQRYPEYGRKVAEHIRYGVDPIDHFAVLWREHRPTILFDLFHLPAKHSGTSEIALNLLLHVFPLLEPDFDLSLGISEEARNFFAPELTGYRVYDGVRQADARFDLVFKPSQIFTWRELHRMVKLGGRLAFTHLDIIAVRCGYLSAPNTQAIFRTAAELADRVMTISEFSRSDFSAFYDRPAPFDVIHLATHESRDRTDPAGRHVFIVGNQFHHKAVSRAVAELQGVGELVAMGGDETPVPGVRWLSSGVLSRAAIAELYDRAAVVVYPSFYEGFGIPIVDALARGIPVVALDNAVNREVQRITDSSRLFLVKDHGELRSVVSAIVGSPSRASLNGRPHRGWGDVAREYAKIFHELLDREVDVDLLRRRWALLTLVDSVHPIDSDHIPHVVQTLLHEQAVLKAELDAAYRSRSWRLTAPIRRLLRSLR
ncbi:MAG TPA: glycosyltransferase [Vicinamibacterales bacterium]|jgi:GT2 family glycosyltransferase|nr:glycosyltransferase [Vicinamibacterales bacterium]